MSGIDNGGAASREKSNESIAVERFDVCAVSKNNACEAWPDAGL